MQHVNVALGSRSETGKGPNYRLRSTGLIPAVVYGKGVEPIKVTVNAHDFGRLIAGTNVESVIVYLKMEGKSEELTAVVREIQRDPLTRRILHVDFFTIRMDQETTFEIPVHGVGVPVGVREGGILETQLRSLHIKCLPTALPASIEVDLLGLRVNNSIHVRDLAIPAGVTVLTDINQVIFNVVPPKEVAVATPAEGEEVAAQPEVIGKKKEEEE